MPAGQTYWRYQVVYTDAGEERCYSLCECHFLREVDTLHAWISRPAIEPIGDTPEQLLSVLAMMREAAQRWQPVAFADLTVGMKIEENPSWKWRISTV